MLLYFRSKFYFNSNNGFKINCKIVGLILFFTVVLYVYTLNSVDNLETFEITDGLYVIDALICGICAITAALKYRGSKIFVKTYFALGLGFLMLSVGYVILNYYEIVLDIESCPSISDIFYLIYISLEIFYLVVF